MTLFNTFVGTVGDQLGVGKGHIIPPYYTEFMRTNLWPNL